jgi:two-component system, NtrC family, response regulator GlrR
VSQARILLVDFNSASGLAGTLQAILKSSRLNLVIRSETLQGRNTSLLDEALSAIQLHSIPNLLFLLLPSELLPRASRLIASIKRRAQSASIAVVVDAQEPAGLLDIVKAGADEFFVPPLRPIDLLPRVCRLIERLDANEMLLESVEQKVGLKQLVGESPAFFEQIEKIPFVAKCNAIVLITGETGTGKELCARAIHYLSGRAKRAFIPLNCGAVPVDLIENEMFGHERGAFTGADNSQPGLIQEAQGGTLFLDEVDCLPLLAQVKFLRFLQEKEYRPLGSTKMRQADVRVIAAANGDPEEAVRNGRLRQDFYYRLNVIPLVLPPLRERKEDIPVLARHFLAGYAVEFDKELTDFAPEAMHSLMVYGWPGNVRELKHVVERAAVLTKHSVIQRSDIVLSRPQTPERQESLRQAKAKVVEHFEKTYIQDLLAAYRGNISRAAEAAQKHRRVFWQLIRKHHIDVERFKPKPL